MQTSAPHPPAKILILRLSALGDILMCTPLLRCLHEQCGAEIYFLTKPAGASLLEGNPHIKEILIFRGSLGLTLQKLHALHFDYIADLHGLFRAVFIRKTLQLLSFLFHARILPSGVYPKYTALRHKAIRRHQKELLPKEHVCLRYFRAFSAQKFPSLHYDGKGMEYFTPSSIKPLLLDLPSSYVALAVGSKHFTKQMPSELISDFCQALPSLPILLVGDHNDKLQADKIIQSCSNLPIPVRSFCGELSLPQSAQVIAHAGVVISPDSLMMHLAAALNRPLISVWGSTVPNLGMYPLYQNTNPAPHIAIENPNLPCRPCHKHGRPTCPLGHFKCMQHPVKEMVKYALKYISTP